MCAECDRIKKLPGRRKAKATTPEGRNKLAGGSGSANYPGALGKACLRRYRPRTESDHQLVMGEPRNQRQLEPVTLTRENTRRGNVRRSGEGETKPGTQGPLDLRSGALLLFGGMQTMNNRDYVSQVYALTGEWIEEEEDEWYWVQVGRLCYAVWLREHAEWYRGKGK